MMHKSLKRTFISLSVVIAVSLLAKAYWDIYATGGYRNQVVNISGLMGLSQAQRAFGNGKLRIYELTITNETEGMHEFTGRYDGSFEIWSHPYNPSLGIGHRLFSQKFVASYNRRMKLLHQNPDRFLREEG